MNIANFSFPWPNPTIDLCALIWGTIASTIDSQWYMLSAVTLG